jgi:hypothetical protein
VAVALLDTELVRTEQLILAPLLDSARPFLSCGSDGGAKVLLNFE